MARCGAVHHLIIKATKNSPLAQNYGRRFLHVRDVHSSSNIYQVHALPDEVLWNLRWTEFDILLSFNTHANNIFSSLSGNMLNTEYAVPKKDLGQQIVPLKAKQIRCKISSWWTSSRRRTKNASHVVAV